LRGNKFSEVFGWPAKPRKSRQNQQSRVNLRWDKKEKSGPPYLSVTVGQQAVPVTRRQEMRRVIVAAAAASMLMGSLAGAAEIEVKMLNKGSEGFMVFEPSFVKAEPGDTIRFVATDKGHNAETIAGMLPDGAVPVAGKMGQDVSVKFDRPGVYGIKCTPHYGMGMVAMIVVGAPSNQDAAKTVNHPGKAKQIFTAMFGRLSAQAAAQ
jgi:pseudoazurin